MREKGREMKITLEELKARKACEPGQIWFAKEFGDSMQVNRKNLHTMYRKRCSYLRWLIREFDLPREECISFPAGAYYYAFDTDEGPRDDTRIMACKDPEYAVLYMICVDQTVRKETLEVITRNPRVIEEYYGEIERIVKADSAVTKSAVLALSHVSPACAFYRRCGREWSLRLL
jgi:hypothetical protein